jgi:polyhydroxyalkanoate synthesis regulator phasin
MMAMMRKAIYFGLGALSLTKDKAEKFFNEMVEKGEVSREEAKTFVDEAIKRGEEEKVQLRAMIREELTELKNLFDNKKTELEDIKKRLADLESKIS